MFETKQNASVRVPVRLIDTGGNPVTGVVYTAVTVTIEKPNGTTANVTMSGGIWSEVTVGAFTGTGKYTLVLPSSVTDVIGVACVAIAATGAVTATNLFKIVALDAADAYSEASLARKMATNKAVEATNQYIVYDDDATTVLKTFNTQDASGSPTSTSIFRRIPV